MPASFWERDAEYRRRIGVIVPFVLAAYAILFFATGRIQYEDIPHFIGWKGELEILPEITVLPELESVVAEPRPEEASANETVALDLVSKGNVPAASAEPSKKAANGEAIDGEATVGQIR